MHKVEIESKLCVVVPCYNEERTIKALLTEVLNQSSVGQVVVINDSSTDRSEEIIRSIEDKRISYLRNEQNLGKGASVAKGINLCEMPFIVIQDADLEYSPREYERMLLPLIDGRADAVFGSRFLAHDGRRVLYFWHHVGNSFLTLLSNIFTNLDLTDMETCYKMMKVDFAKRLKIREKRFGIEPEITAKLAKDNARIYEVAISYSGRTYAEGKKITWKDGFSALRCIILYNFFDLRSKDKRTHF